MSDVVVLMIVVATTSVENSERDFESEKCLCCVEEQLALDHYLLEKDFSFCKWLLFSPFERPLLLQLQCG